MAVDNMVSAVIITKNEEKNITRCLDSLIGIADEIIVVDSYSEDKTPQICSEREVRFIQTEWKGYAETKNYGNSCASHPYILSLDADEALSKELQDEIIELKKQGFSSEAYIIKRMTNYCGKWIRHCGWYPDWKLRLWKKDQGQWIGEIHEKIELSGPVTVKELKNDILHYSYYSINEHIHQMIRYSDVAAKDDYRRKKRYGLCKLIFGPIIKFLKSYIIQRGFRDGFYGLVICSLSGMATFLKYAKILQLQRNNTK